MKVPIYSRYKNNIIYRRFKKANNSIRESHLNIQIRSENSHGTYGALLFRPEWKLLRQKILKRDAEICVICNSSKALQVHHRQYHFVVIENRFKLPWDYPENLLITLCESCHKRGHNKFKVPTINI